MARIASKLERAVRALLIVHGKATFDDCFISNDSRTRNILPNRTVLAHAQVQTRSYREEGEVHFGIQHHFPIVDQPGTAPGTQSVAMDAYVNDTEATLFGLDPVGKSLDALADEITAAGRWLAQTDNTPAGDLFATQNADMVNFRCDWVKASNPYLTRGNVENEKTAIWAEILNFSAGVSTATDPN